MGDANLSAFIWSIADLLRGDYKQSEYSKVILPFTVLLRLDCVLEPKQAGSNSKEHFDNSPNVDKEIGNAIIDAMEAHEIMSAKALNHATVRNGIKDILLNHLNLWKLLRKEETPKEGV